MERAINLSLLIVFLFSYSCLAVHFEYDSGRIHSQCQTTATYDGTTDDQSGLAWKTEMDGYTIAEASSNASVEGPSETAAYSGADSYLGFDTEYDIDGSVQVFGMTSISAEIISSNSDAYSDAGSETVHPGQSTGIFFEVVGDAGENIGDIVEITLNWSGSVSVTDNGEGRADNGFLEGPNIVVAVNPANIENPEPGSRVWERQSLSLDYDGYIFDNDQVTFEAEIGDIVGVFFGVYGNITISSPGDYGEVTADQEFILSPVYIGERPYTAADADIDGSGKVDIGDLAIIAKFWLQDVPTSGDGSTCQHAIEVAGYGTVIGDNYDALLSDMSSCAIDQEFDDSNAVWYKFTVPANADVRFATEGYGVDGLDASLAIYDACGGTELGCHEAWVDEVYLSGLTAGQTVYIRVGGYNLDEGEFELTIEEFFPS